MKLIQKEKMTPYIAVFNSNEEDLKRAKEKFLDFTTQKSWDTEIQPKIDAGLMSIFNSEPTQSQFLFVYLLSKEVNDRRACEVSLKR